LAQIPHKKSLLLGAQDIDHQRSSILISSYNKLVSNKLDLVESLWKQKHNE
jgi:hypothetical protein